MTGDSELRVHLFEGFEVVFKLQISVGVLASDHTRKATDDSLERDFEL